MDNIQATEELHWLVDVGVYFDVHNLCAFVLLYLFAQIRPLERDHFVFSSIYCISIIVSCLSFKWHKF